MIGVKRIVPFFTIAPVGLSKRISQVTKSCQFQFLTVTIVIKLVERLCAENLTGLNLTPKLRQHVYMLGRGALYTR